MTRSPRRVSLGDVVAAATRSLERRRRVTPRAEVERAASRRMPRGQAFLAALSDGGPAAIVAECKRRSPSKGLLRDAYDPAAIARSYEQAGAAAVSVLTEEHHFGGSMAHLSGVRAATTLPVLRKDFVVDEYQLDEARAGGADAVLLIAAILEVERLQQFLRLARSLGLAALVEAHDERDLDRALDAGARIVGVNNRDLRTMQVDLRAAERLAARLPAGTVAVAESGIGSRSDVDRLRQFGYHAFLVGERLMTAADPGAALRELLAGGDVERPNSADRKNGQ